MLLLLQTLFITFNLALFKCYFKTYFKFYFILKLQLYLLNRPEISVKFCLLCRILLSSRTVSTFEFEKDDFHILYCKASVSRYKVKFRNIHRSQLGKNFGQAMCPKQILKALVSTRKKQQRQ